MIQISEKGYEELLKKFYRTAIQNHSNRHELMPRMIQIINRLSSSSRETAKQDSNFLEIDTLGMFSPTSPSTISPSYKDRPRLHKLGSKQSRQFDSEFANLQKKFSYSSRSINSGDDIRKSREDQNQIKEQQKYFNCEWIYSHDSFKKVFSFALVYLMLQENNLYNFTKLTESINHSLEDDNDMSNDEINKIGHEWSKLNQTFQKKDKVRWQKIIHEIFASFPEEFVDIMFGCLTQNRTPAESLQEPISSANVDAIHKASRVNIDYFQIFYKDISGFQYKSNNYKEDICIGYCKEDEIYLLANRTPQKSEKQIRKDKVSQQLSEVISDLLSEYEKNTEKLLKLEVLAGKS